MSLSPETLYPQRQHADIALFREIFLDFIKYNPIEFQIELINFTFVVKTLMRRFNYYQRIKILLKLEVLRKIY